MKTKIHSQKGELTRKELAALLYFNKMVESYNEKEATQVTDNVTFLEVNCSFRKSLNFNMYFRKTGISVKS